MAAVEHRIIFGMAKRPPTPRARAAVAVPAPLHIPEASGLGASRHAQLLADLRLSVEERVRAAEETARVSVLLRPPRGAHVLRFDRYEDFLDWQDARNRGE
jgi:hypothetical protein